MGGTSCPRVSSSDPAPCLSHRKAPQDQHSLGTLHFCEKTWKKLLVSDWLSYTHSRQSACEPEDWRFFFSLCLLSINLFNKNKKISKRINFKGKQIFSTEHLAMQIMHYLLNSE